MSNYLLSNEEILSIVNDLQSLPGTEDARVEYCKTHHKEFYENFGILAEKACQRNFDRKRFEFMLAMRAKVVSQDISQHDASVVVGQELVDAFVKPMVENESAAP